MMKCFFFSFDVTVYSGCFSLYFSWSQTSHSSLNFKKLEYFALFHLRLRGSAICNAAQAFFKMSRNLLQKNRDIFLFCEDTSHKNIYISPRGGFFLTFYLNKRVICIKNLFWNIECMAVISRFQIMRNTFFPCTCWVLDWDWRLVVFAVVPLLNRATEDFIFFHVFRCKRLWERVKELIKESQRRVINIEIKLMRSFKNNKSKQHLKISLFFDQVSPGYTENCLQKESGRRRDAREAERSLFPRACFHTYRHGDPSWRRCSYSHIS